MKIILLFALLLFTGSSWSQTDENPFIGKWSFYRMNTAHSRLSYSADEKEQNKIIDDVAKEIGEESGILNADTLKMMLREELQTIAKITFTFNSDGTLVIESNDSGISTQTYSIDAKKQEIHFRGAEVFQIYSYTIQGSMIEFRREDESFILMPAKQ